MSSIGIDDVITHATLDDYLGGKLDGDEALLPDAWEGSSAPARQAALDEVLSTLRSRTPPIFANEIADPTELAVAVRHGAAEIIYRNASTTGRNEEIHVYQADKHGERFRQILSNLQVTLSTGGRGTVGSVAMHRR